MHQCATNSCSPAPPLPTGLATHLHNTTNQEWNPQCCNGWYSENSSRKQRAHQDCPSGKYFVAAPRKQQPSGCTERPTATAPPPPPNALMSRQNISSPPAFIPKFGSSPMIFLTLRCYRYRPRYCVTCCAAASAGGRNGCKRTQHSPINGCGMPVVCPALKLPAQTS